MWFASDKLRSILILKHNVCFGLFALLLEVNFEGRALFFRGCRSHRVENNVLQSTLYAPHCSHAGEPRAVDILLMPNAVVFPVFKTGQVNTRTERAS